jgi:hypothetical protein
LFLMYQGALTMFLSTLFWNRCIMSILFCLVQPPSWIPYVQTGFTVTFRFWHYRLKMLESSKDFVIYREIRSAVCVISLSGAFHLWLPFTGKSSRPFSNTRINNCDQSQWTVTKFREWSN